MAQKKILVVEDDSLIAMDMEMTLSDAGFEVLGPCFNVAEATELLNVTRPDAALLDLNLGHKETSIPLAERLLSDGVPVTFLTGYTGAVPGMPATLERIPRLPKPVSVAILLETLRQ